MIKNTEEAIPTAKEALEKAEDSDAETLKAAADALSEPMTELGRKMHEAGHDPEAAKGEQDADAKGEPEIMDTDEAKEDDKK